MHAKSQPVPATRPACALVSCLRMVSASGLRFRPPLSVSAHAGVADGARLSSSALSMRQRQSFPSLVRSASLGCMPRPASSCIRSCRPVGKSPV